MNGGVTHRTYRRRVPQLSAAGYPYIYIKPYGSDGSFASTPEENAVVFAEHFKSLYGREPSIDASVLNALPQRLVVTGADHAPTDIEIRTAVSKLNDTAPGDSGLKAPLWKALISTSEGFALVRQMVNAFWESGEVPVEWETGLLAILPKKGDLSLPGNYRGIMMLEVAYKIVSNVVLGRLRPIKESLNHESQCGFRRMRGSCDATFALRQLIAKRREHGLESWVLFIDLVKAFDRVPRELLWLVMLKQGVPPKLVSLLKSMHASVLVKFEVEGVAKTLDSIMA